MVPLTSAWFALRVLAPLPGPLLLAPLQLPDPLELLHQPLRRDRFVAPLPRRRWLLLVLVPLAEVPEARPAVLPQVALERLVPLHFLALVLALLVPLGQHRLLPLLEAMAQQEWLAMELLAHWRLLLMPVTPLLVSVGLRPVEKQSGEEQASLRPSAQSPLEELLRLRAGLFALSARLAVSLLVWGVVTVRLSSQHLRPLPAPRPHAALLPHVPAFPLSVAVTVGVVAIEHAGRLPLLLALLLLGPPEGLLLLRLVLALLLLALDPHELRLEQLVPPPVRQPTRV